MARRFLGDRQRHDRRGVEKITGFAALLGQRITPDRPAHTRGGVSGNRQAVDRCGGRNDAIAQQPRQFVVRRFLRSAGDGLKPSHWAPSVEDQHRRAGFDPSINAGRLFLAR